ncbi:MAG: class IV adenylate cyclase [Treponema sp.]|nr:class IV adenylate cyclase [Treponema sp.]
MYEIELKAHVDDRTAVISALNGFAVYEGAVQKADTYYALKKDGKKISARIRVESSERDGTKILLTYKRKELRVDEKGTSTEVNDEKECSLSSVDAVFALLQDIGFKVSLKKNKSVMSWRYDGALFELCEVPPLGDFLEIEILSSTNDSKTVKSYQKKLQELLDKTGIPHKNIENRYYSEMLRTFQNDEVK